MRGMMRIFLLAVLVLILASAFASAEGSLALPTTDKAINSGFTVITFENITYRIFSANSYRIYFERVDVTHNRIFLIPVAGEQIPYYDVYIQWGLFPPVCLDIGAGGEESYLLGSETGYAEK